MAIIQSCIKPKPLESLLNDFTNQKMVLGIDIDNCLTDTNPEILKLANEMYYYRYPNQYYKKVLERPLTEEDITNFDYGKCTSLNNDEVNELFKEMVKKEKYLTLKLLPNALQVLNKLEKFYYFYFVTARPKDAKNQTLSCFKNNGIEKYSNRIIIDRDKVKIAKRNKMISFIEDRAETALKLAENNIKVLLFDYPWNNRKDQEIVQKINTHQNIKRIYNTPKSYWLNLEKELLK